MQVTILGQGAKIMPNIIVSEFPIAEDVLTLFWSKVKIIGNGCWVWTGARNRGGMV